MSEGMTLEPCPFCGLTPSVRIPTERDGFAAHIACRCGAQLYGHKRHFSGADEAIIAWNTRHLSQPAERVMVPDGCTPDDAAILRKANHQLAGEIDRLREALQFYADKCHFGLSDEDAWDTVSGEPQNYWCDEAGTATIEDGTVARQALLSATPSPAERVRVPDEVCGACFDTGEVTDQYGNKHKCYYGCAASPPAAGVPDEIPEGAVIFGDEDDDGYRMGWNACRNAMLSAAPEASSHD